MTGLEKIIAEIAEDAEKNASEITGQAKVKAAEIIAQAKDKAQEEYTRIQLKAQAGQKTEIERADSAAQLEIKRSVLSVKQELIDGIIDKAKEEILNLSDTDYFNLVTKLAVKYAWASQGEIRFNKKDLARAPKELINTINAGIKGKGAQLVLDAQPADIDGGFVLIYGGIEENCSVESMFADAKESMQDRVHQLLFG